MIVPPNPVSQVHPDPTSVPDESAGHSVATQLPEKNGADEVAATVPLVASNSQIVNDWPECCTVMN